MNQIFELKSYNYLSTKNIKINNSIITCLNKQENLSTDSFYGKKFILKMIKANTHFGHKIREWNPKMSPFIYERKKGIHIIDTLQSYIYLKKICKFLYKQASNNDYKTFLFIGTRKQSSIPPCTSFHASSCNSFFVNTKWLSGMLTNWENTKKSINELKYLKIYNKTNEFKKLSMKNKSLLLKRKISLQKNFGGIEKMKKVPDVVFLIGQNNEINANRECINLGIRHITLLDTNCNPDLADIFIPANDDSHSSLNLILGEFQTAINIGRQKLQNKLPKKEIISICNNF